VKHYILLVEDNELNSDMLSRRLEFYGYEVDIAADGKQCIEKLATRLPDLILMDISLPDRNGDELTVEIKADKLTEAIPVIALTSHAMGGDRQKYMAFGFDEYDTKPVDLERLLTKMKRFLEK